jgi:hypothetical protein
LKVPATQVADAPLVAAKPRVQPLLFAGVVFVTRIF